MQERLGNFGFDGNGLVAEIKVSKECISLENSRELIDKLNLGGGLLSCGFHVNPSLTVDEFKKMVTADYGVTEFKVSQ